MQVQSLGPGANVLMNIQKKKKTLLSFSSHVLRSEFLPLAVRTLRPLHQLIKFTFQLKHFDDSKLSVLSLSVALEFQFNFLSIVY